MTTTTSPEVPADPVPHDRPGPLAGVRVVDLTRFMAGPIATMVLAEGGADVIKVEPPSGDPMRADARNTCRGGMSASFLNSNRAKRAIAVDLKDPRGVEVVQRLVERADVVVENFRPGVADRLGIGYERAAELNPGIVYASASGWGTVGPLADRMAYDSIIQSYAGVAAIQGRARDGGPEPVRTVLADKVAPLLLANAVTAALFERSRSGRGQRIQTNMLQSLIWWMWPDAYERETFVGEGASIGVDPASTQRAVYPTADGHLAVVFSGEGEWRAFCEAADRPELAGGPFDATTHEIYDRVAATLATRTTEDWVDRLSASGKVCFGPVHETSEIVADPQVRALGAVAEVEDPVVGRVRVPSHFAHYSRTPTEPAAAPSLGQHTHEVLTELGYSPERIDGLAGDGVVVCRPPAGGRP